MIRLLPIAICVITLTSFACKDESAQPKPATPSTSTDASNDKENIREFLNKESTPPTAGSSTRDPDLPAGHPPIEGGRQMTPRANADATLPSGHPPISGAATKPEQPSVPVGFEAPENWESEKPKSAMRAAQYRLPRAEGDPEDGQMIVYYFGPNQGGGVDDNLNRWIDFFSNEDGSPVRDADAKIERIESNGLSITTLDVAGRYTDMMSRANQPGPTPVDFRMLSAIAVTPDGRRVFFKAVGPKPTMTAHKDAFDKLVKSLKSL